MTQYDIRWHQRLLNFDKALSELEEAVNLASKRKLTKLEEQGLIQAFEYNYELAWNSLKDFYQAQGDVDIQGSRDTFRLAFKRGLIEDGKLWMEMIQSRILTSHTYNESTAAIVADKILHAYYPAFIRLNRELNKLKNEY